MSAKTILVVEDEPLVGMELEEGLTRLGYKVPQVITSGDEVQDAVDRYSPDLVLMDIRIGGSMDGVQAAAKIRETSDVPVLFLTAYSDSQTITRAAQILPDGYLLKPFGERELAANIELALCKARSPLRREKSLKKLLPLIDALGSSLCLFDRDGHWIHGNAEARKTLELPANPLLQGPDLFLLLGSTEEDFASDPAHWAGREYSGLFLSPGTRINKTLTLEALPDREGRLMGFLGLLDPMGKKEREYLNDSAFSVNETIEKLLPENGIFSERLESAGFLIPSPSGTGDFYDLFPLGPRHFVFYNLDVMGHGPLPAMVAYSLRVAIRDLAGNYLKRHDTVPPPSELLGALNRKFTPRTDQGLFFTITLGLLVPATGDFSLCRAGHTRSVWMKANGDVTLLKGTGTALGAFPDIELEEIRGRLEPEDRLILFSDGVLEALGEKDLERGYSVLSEQLKTSASRDTAALVYSLRSKCLSTVGKPEDDLSLLALRPNFEAALIEV